MLVITIGSCAGQPEFAIDLWMNVNTFRAICASGEVFAFLSRMKKRTVLLVTFGEETTFDFLVLNFTFISLRPFKVYFFGVEPGHSSLTGRICGLVITTHFGLISYLIQARVEILGLVSLFFRWRFLVASLFNLKSFGFFIVVFFVDFLPQLLRMIRFFLFVVGYYGVQGKLHVFSMLLIRLCDIIFSISFDFALPFFGMLSFLEFGCYGIDHVVNELFGLVIRVQNWT